jgi:glycosyltransferase involved in cell wall biosynthesis
MRVAQVCPGYFPDVGGVESHVEAISEWLARNGVVVDVLATDSTGLLPRQDKRNGVNIYRFASWAPNGAFYFSTEMITYLARNARRYEIVHAHNYHALPALYASWFKNGSKFVFTPHYHGRGHTHFRDFLHVPWKRLAKGIFDKADRIISVSEYERRLILRDFSIDQTKVRVLKNGLNPEEFAFPRPLQRLVDDQKLKILCVSRIEKYKGIQFIIRSLPLLPSGVELDVVGDGPYKNRLLNEATNLGVGSRVHFSQNLSRLNLIQKYSEADLFVLLSSYESFGLVVGEALAAGLPCIVANASALAEWVDHRNCFGVNLPVDVANLARLITNVSKVRVEAFLARDWRQVGSDLMGVYTSLF